MKDKDWEWVKENFDKYAEKHINEYTWEYLDDERRLKLQHRMPENLKIITLDSFFALKEAAKNFR